MKFKKFTAFLFFENMTIQEKRRKIDTIDREIIDLLIERSATSREISMLKISAGLPISDRSRETSVISTALANAGGCISDAAIFQIYEAIMAESRRVQQAVRHELFSNGAMR